MYTGQQYSILVTEHHCVLQRWSQSASGIFEFFFFYFTCQTLEEALVLSHVHLLSLQPSFA